MKKKGTILSKHKIASLDAAYSDWKSVGEAVNYFDQYGEPGRQFVVPNEGGLSQLYIYQGVGKEPTPAGSGKGDYIPLTGTEEDKPATGMVMYEDYWGFADTTGTVTVAYSSAAMELAIMSESGMYSNYVNADDTTISYQWEDMIYNRAISVEGSVQYIQEIENDNNYTSHILTFDKVETMTSYENPKGGLERYRFIIGREGIKAYSGDDPFISQAGADVITMYNLQNFNQPTNWGSSTQRMTALPNKSEDALYNLFLGMDANGNIAKFDNAYNLLHKSLSTMTQTQSLALGQLLNGGQGSSGAMSVNLISPPIVQNRFDSVEYILLRGANLLLNNTDMSISICDANQNVIQVIPNNQIINNSATELIFYYNFHNFSTGTYFLKITSGSKVYFTQLSLTIIEEVENINLENVTWEILYAEDVTPDPSDYAVGSNVVITSPNVGSAVPKIAVKSSELFEEGDDFYLEYTVDIGSKSALAENNRTYIGVGYSSTLNSLVNNSLVHYSFSYDYSASIKVYNNTNPMGTVITPNSATVVLIKTGNLFRMIIGNNNYSTTLSNNSGYSMFISMVGRSVKQAVTTKLIKAFKFNNQ